MQRIKLVGPVLISLGLLFLTSAYISMDDAETGERIHVINELQWWQFRIPRSYDIIPITEYAIPNLIIGTAALTTGTILTIQEKRKKP